MFIPIPDRLNAKTTLLGALIGGGFGAANGALWGNSAVSDKIEERYPGARDKQTLLRGLLLGAGGALAGGYVGALAGAKQAEEDMDLYTAVIEKRAFNISSHTKHVAGGALIGGALGGGLGYISPSQADVKNDPNIRLKSMAANGVLSGIFGGAIGHDLHSMGPGRRERYEEYWKSHGGEAAHDAGEAAREAASHSARRAASEAFDPMHHGKGAGRMWDTILNSTELSDPAKHAAAVDFMKSVGRPGANVDALKQHMAHFPQDTLTGQMMTVLFNKHHGAKVASLEAHMKLAAWDVYAAYGVW